MVKTAKLRLSSMPMSKTKGRLMDILKSVEQAPLTSEDALYNYDIHRNKEYKNQGREE